MVLVELAWTGAFGLRCYASSGWGVGFGAEGFDLSPRSFLWLAFAVREDPWPQDSQICEEAAWSDWRPWHHSYHRSYLWFLGAGCEALPCFYILLQKAVGSRYDSIGSSVQAISAWCYARCLTWLRGYLSLCFHGGHWMGGLEREMEPSSYFGVLLAGGWRLHVDPWVAPSCQNSDLEFGRIFLGSHLVIEACSAGFERRKSFYHKWFLSLAWIGSCWNVSFSSLWICKYCKVLCPETAGQLRSCRWKRDPINPLKQKCEWLQALLGPQCHPPEKLLPQVVPFISLDWQLLECEFF